MGGGGGGSSAGGGAKAANVSKKKTQSKTNCVVCKCTTNKVPSNREGAVQCGVCDCWWHPKCAQLSTEKFEMIAKWTEDGSQSPWKCQSCDNAGAKLLKMVTVLSSRVGENEKKLEVQAGRMDRVEDKSKLQDSRLDSQGREIKELKEQLAKLGDMGGPSVVREMDERSLKENNLVFHRVLEAGEEDARKRIDYDKGTIQQLLNVLEVDIGVEQHTKFARRLGPRTGDTEGEERRVPRPLLVGFTHRHHTELILENSWKLSEADNMAIRTVSVVRDLTLRQRAGEKEMHKEAARKNLSRSQENLEGNMAFKIVGRRGAKREILAPLRVGEEINMEGEVTWVNESEGGAAGGRRIARGGRQLGPSAATYPNCLVLGRKGGGGTTMGQSLGTALGQRPNQNTAFGRGGGRGCGGGITADRPGGSREQQAEEGRWITAGRGGSARARDSSRSPPIRRGPPEKKLDFRASPETVHARDIPLTTDLKSQNMYKLLAEEEEEEEEEEVVDDVVVVV